ncbi:unnamed protein product, partial [Effrenium voratum]
MNRFSEGAPKVDGSIFHVEDHAAQREVARFREVARLRPRSDLTGREPWQRGGRLPVARVPGAGPKSAESAAGPDRR